MLSHAALQVLEVAGVAFGRTLRVCSLRPAYEPCRAHRVRFSSHSRRGAGLSASLPRPAFVHPWTSLSVSTPACNARRAAMLSHAALQVLEVAGVEPAS